MTNWQDISTAPLKPFDPDKWWADNFRCLASDGRRVTIGIYGYTKHGKGRWQDEHRYSFKPTHWMPLPEPPQPPEERR